MIESRSLIGAYCADLSVPGKNGNERVVASGHTSSSLAETLTDALRSAALLAPGWRISSLQVRVTVHALCAYCGGTGESRLPRLRPQRCGPCLGHGVLWSAVGRPIVYANGQVTE